MTGQARWVLIVGLAILATLNGARAEFPDGFNHPEVQWMEIETDHFLLVFSEGLEATAQEAADILESIHEPMCEALGTKPLEKTTVIFTDFDDVGVNNFARRMEHVIYISNPVMNQARFDRGRWLTHLLRHEYVHVLNGWALRGYGRAIGPMIEWQGMDLQPQWFTEGLAEFVASGGGEESVYILQAANEGLLLAGGKLDIADARFDVMETSMVYRQGYSMCRAMAQRYGDDIFRRLLEQYGHVPQWDIAFKIATGEHVEKFYKEWLKGVREKADALPREEALDADSTTFDTPLEAALGGRLSPDGSLLAFYGIWDWEQPLTALYLMRPDGTKVRKIAGNLDLYDSWKLSWSPDGRYLLYTGRIKAPTGSILNALYIYDAEKDKSWKIKTGGTRTVEAEFSPDGRRIAFTSYRGERALIATIAPDGSDLRYVTHRLAQDCFSPTWSPDGKRLAFSVVDAEGVDIATIALDGSDFQRLTEDQWPDQYPAWSPDGERIAFVSYRATAEDTGGSAAVAGEAEGLSVAGTNIYAVPAGGGELEQLTRATTGGVYYPSWTADGRQLLVSLFRIRTADVRLIDLEPAATATAPSERPVAAVPSLATLQRAGVRIAALPDPSGGALLSVPEPSVVRSAMRLAASPDQAGPPERSPAAGASTPDGDGAPLGPPATAVQAVGAGPATSAAAANQRVARPYRASAHVRPYITRPFSEDDGLGDTIGVRTRMTDPLRKHTILAQADYGLESNKLGYKVQYLNDQTSFRVGANVFRRVPPLRGERGALVAEQSEGFEALAELPITIGNNIYAQDKLRFGFEYAKHRPFRTSGGVLRPPPAGATIAGPSVGFNRVQLWPGIGDQEITARMMRADAAFGSDLDFFKADTLWVGRFYAPDPRRQFLVGAGIDYFDGQDFTSTEVAQLVFNGEVRYEVRLVDDLFSEQTWPYLHIGPVTVGASYTLRELVNGIPAGADLRDLGQLELVNQGYVTRHGTYQLRLAQRFYVGGGNTTDFLATLELQFRDLPF